jgi:hypothetical protein
LTPWSWRKLQEKKGRNLTGLGVREFFVERRANHALVAFVAPRSVGTVAAIIVRAAPKLAGAGVLDESERQVFIVVEVIQDLVIRVTECGARGCREHHEQRSVILAVRHVAATASKTREVDAGTTAGDGKSAPGAAVSTRWATHGPRVAISTPWFLVVRGFILQVTFSPVGF